jgi:hypothetical protein
VIAVDLFLGCLVDGFPQGFPVRFPMQAPAQIGAQKTQAISQGERAARLETGVEPGQVLDPTQIRLDADWFTNT